MSDGRGSRRKGDAAPGCSICLRNLPQSLGEEELQKDMQRFGSVKDVYMPRHRRSREKKGFAFVEFENEEAARTAVASLDNQVYKGRDIKCEIARESRKTPDEMRRQQQTTRSLGNEARHRRSSDRGRRERPRSRRRRDSPDNVRRRDESASYDDRRRSRRGSRSRSASRERDRRRKRSRSPRS